MFGLSSKDYVGRGGAGAVLNRKRRFYHPLLYAVRHRRRASHRAVCACGQTETLGDRSAGLSKGRIRTFACHCIERRFREPRRRTDELPGTQRFLERVFSSSMSRRLAPTAESRAVSNVSEERRQTCVVVPSRGRRDRCRAALPGVGRVGATLHWSRLLIARRSERSNPRTLGLAERNALASANQV